MRACSTCGRHVRTREGRCPFCGARLAAAAAVLGAAIVAGCQAPVQPVPVYGVPAPPSASPTPEASVPPPAPLYGAPAPARIAPSGAE